MIAPPRHAFVIELLRLRRRRGSIVTHGAQGDAEPTKLETAIGNKRTLYAGRGTSDQASLCIYERVDKPPVTPYTTVHLRCGEAIHAVVSSAPWCIYVAGNTIAE
jgi:hypothetical protein